MLRDPPRIALVLLASIAGLLIAGAVARAEPAAAASSSTDAGCLAKPNAPSAPGNHWYYRVDRASGRHCWYERPTIGAANEAAQSRSSMRAANDAAQSRSSTRAIVSPAQNAKPDVAVDRLNAPRDQARDQKIVEPAATAPVQPYSWSTATPAPMPREQTTPASNGSAAPAMAVAPPADAVAEPPPIKPSPVATVRPPVPQRPAAIVADTHLPALFGAALALVLIVLGSICARLVAKLIRSRRRGAVAHASAAMTPPPILHAQDSPGLVPMAEDDLTREVPPSWMMRNAPAARPDAATPADAAAARNRDGARELEQNVRELLHRMRGDLRRISGASPNPNPQPRSPQEPDELLASWRGRRRPSARQG